MPPVIPNYEPSRFVAGETVTWEKSLSDFSASDGWVLKYFLRGPSRLDITCTADSNNHVATIAPVDSAKLKPGRYYLQGRVELNGEKHIITPEMLELEIAPGLDAESANFDGRSQAERIVAELDALIEKTLPGDRAEYTIDNQHKRHYSRDELMRLRNVYQQKVNGERRRKRIAAGGDFFQKVPARLVPTR
jgi:hypothetical protein